MGILGKRGRRRRNRQWSILGGATKGGDRRRRRIGIGNGGREVLRLELRNDELWILVGDPRRIIAPCELLLEIPTDQIDKRTRQLRERSSLKVLETRKIKEGGRKLRSKGGQRHRLHLRERNSPAPRLRRMVEVAVVTFRHRGRIQVLAERRLVEDMEEAGAGEEGALIGRNVRNGRMDTEMVGGTGGTGEEELEAATVGTREEEIVQGGETVEKAGQGDEDRLVGSEALFSLVLDILARNHHIIIHPSQNRLVDNLSRLSFLQCLFIYRG